MNQLAFETVLEPDGMRGHWLAVDAKTRQALAIRDGDIVTVEMEPSKVWPEPDVPEDFQAALSDAPDISEAWKGIKLVDVASRFPSRSFERVCAGRVASIWQHAPSPNYRGTAN